MDLDIVNPFFRSAEQGAWLEANGVRLLAPTFALTAVDIPALPADILSVFSDEGLKTVFDVGGDDAGALALGRYNRYFLEHGYELIYVVNMFRPRSGSVQEIMDMMSRVSECSRLRPTGLINNSNLGNLTDQKTVEEGHELMLAVSRGYTRADYLPCILWGRTAAEGSARQIRDIIRICGRLQSRIYTKQTDNGPEERTAYEISALTAQFPEESV